MRSKLWETLKHNLKNETKRSKPVGYQNAHKRKTVAKKSKKTKKVKAGN